mmetsp:Transcript_63401/g.138263  ORF Transcript_63401/g.138263 Transcript_63401/m.138263 type:complete len:219 (-) Transcript_63401:1623-2279(-)
MCFTASQSECRRNVPSASCTMSCWTPIGSLPQVVVTRRTWLKLPGTCGGASAPTLSSSSPLLVGQLLRHSTTFRPCTNREANRRWTSPPVLGSRVPLASTGPSSGRPQKSGAKSNSSASSPARVSQRSTRCSYRTQRNSFGKTGMEESEHKRNARSASSSYVQHRSWPRRLGGRERWRLGRELWTRSLRSFPSSPSPGPSGPLFNFSPCKQRSPRAER